MEAELQLTFMGKTKHKKTMGRLTFCRCNFNNSWQVKTVCLKMRTYFVFKHNNQGRDIDQKRTNYSYCSEEKKREEYKRQNRYNYKIDCF